jgi:threonine dehydrogenase-like Zn-dependent dehydrogenase
MEGEVVAVGPSATTVRPGDIAVLTVRRGCGACGPCEAGRADMCATGDYLERGIWGLDGYQSEYVVDDERYVVAVPPALADVAVLAEPLSVAEKAIDEAVRVQGARLPGASGTADWLSGRTCLVAGLGPIGLLAAMVLRLRGAAVLGLDVVDAASPRPQWLQTIGGKYLDGRRVPIDQIRQHGPADVIIEAAGIARLEFDLLEALGPDGVYVLTGIPGDVRPFSISGGELVQRLVLGNQAMVGSVNASRDHFAMAVEDLGRAEQRWSGLVAKLITDRRPYSDVATALNRHPADEIKSVIEWAVPSAESLPADPHRRDNGRVTLAGAVGSKMDKTEAGMIARSTFGVFSVDNELKVAA